MQPASNTIVSFLLPNLCLGGAEKVTVHLANGLAARGYNVDMVLFEARGEFLSDLDPKICVVDLKASRMLSAVPRFAAFLRKRRPSVVISALEHVNIGAIFARQLSGTSIPVVVAIHSTRSMAAMYKQGFRRHFLRIGARWCYPRASRIICVSRGVADDFALVTGIRRNQLRVIYNPVVTNQVRALSCESLEHPWFAPGAPPVVLAVGRLSAVKDYASLVRAFDIVRQKHTARLMILGEGEDRPRLQGLIAQLQLESCVALPGFGANPYAYLSRAALFVLSSLSEALPTALIEALALGTPVIATDCKCGPREILQNGRFGTLVPVGDVAVLAEAISTMLVAPRPQLSPEAVYPFTLEHAMDEYCQLIGEVSRE
jgi:glycosyltransferase involved in cell wall biosynthesis